MRTKGARWSVLSDGGHLWLVMHNDRVVAIFRDWNLAIHRANREARKNR